MSGILDDIDAAVAADKVVYVHCMAGLGRTGVVVGCYLVHHGTSGTEALDEIPRLRAGITGGPMTSPYTEAQRHDRWYWIGPGDRVGPIDSTADWT
jgi:protein-tyrosine phosphatase